MEVLDCKWFLKWFLLEKDVANLLSMQILEWGDCSNHVTPIELKAACLAAFLFSLFKKVSDQVSDLTGHLIQIFWSGTLC